MDNRDKEQVNRLPVWPFWLADGLILFWVALVWAMSDAELTPALLSFMILGILLGAGIGVAPYIINWRLDQVRRRDRVQRDYQAKVALALGEILARVEDLPAVSPDGQDSLVELLGGVNQNLKELEERLSGLIRENDGKESKQVIEAIEPCRKQLEEQGKVLEKLGAEWKEWRAKLEVLETNGQKGTGGRRGVSGILYPEGTAASWVGREPPSEVTSPKPEDASDVPAPPVEESPLPEEEIPPAPTPAKKRPRSSPRKSTPATAESEQSSVEENAGDSAESTSDAALEADSTVEIKVLALIGIGNKPYLRGNLEGLSMERGVPCDFVEIGKWAWQGKRGAEKAPVVEVWLNDETPAANQPFELGGATLEIRPVFS